MLFNANGIYQNMRCFINHIFACSTTYDHMKTTKYTLPILSMIQLWQYSMLLLRANCPKLNIALHIERHNDLNPVVVPTDKTDLTHLPLGTSVWYFEYKMFLLFFRVVSSGNKPSPEPMLIHIYIAIWRYKSTMGESDGLAYISLGIKIAHGAVTTQVSTAFGQ